MNWGEAALDVILAYLMDNAVKSNNGEPIEVPAHPGSSG